MLPIDQDFLIKAIVESTSSVFSMMLDSAVVPGPPGLDAEEVEGGLVSLVGITGAWSGTGSFCCTPGVAGRLYARLLLMDPPAESDAITDEIMDGMAELTNMIVGNIKLVLEERVGPMAINIPMVVYGRNFQFKRVGGTTGISIPFVWGRDRVEVRLFLAPAAEKSRFIRDRADSLILQRR
jgi:chemotaxis protein CheX